MKKLLIISGYIDDSRPTGGVTMHVHRMMRRLIEPCVIDYDVCDYKKESIRIQLLKIKKADVFHSHVSNPFLKLFYVLAGKLFNTKSLITVHGKYGIYKPFHNFIHRLALKWCDVPLLINQESYNAVVMYNPNSVFIPAFIPPIDEEEKLNLDMEKQIQSIRSLGRPLFVTNASSRAFTESGLEVYGIDFLISFFTYHLNYSLVILDPTGEYQQVYRLNKPGNVWVFSGKHSFCGLIKMSDVVIRNTCTDGDSFSVKEALCLHKPVLVTDVVSRPQGVFLFKYNDSDSLEKGVEKALNRSVEDEHEIIDATDAYKELYHKMGIC